MNNKLFLFLISFKLFAVNIYDIENITLEKENIGIKKEKYMGENLNLSKLVLLNYDIELLNKEIELKKSVIEYKKEKADLLLELKTKEQILEFYNKKEKFFSDYLHKMKQNKENFSILDIKEAQLYMDEVLQEIQEFLYKIELSQIKVEKFYDKEFEENTENYEEWLENKISLCNSYLDNKNKLLNISGESIFNKEIAANDGNSNKNQLSQEFKNLNYNREKLKKSKELTEFKLKGINNKITTYKLKAEKKEKQLKLGMITQKDYFDFYNEYFNLEINKMDLQKELGLIEIEKKLYN